MVYWNILYHSDYQSIHVMLVKAEIGDFPPTSRRYMQEWCMEELAMLAQIPEGSPNVVHQAMVEHDMRADTSPIWKDLYARATRLGWYLMRFGV